MKRYGKERTAALKALSKLTPNDCADVEKFRGFLQDLSTMGKDKCYQKHEAYLFPKSIKG